MNNYFKLLAKLVSAAALVASVSIAHAAPCTGELSNCGFEVALGAGNWVAVGGAEITTSEIRSGVSALRGAGDSQNGSVTQEMFGSSIGFDLEFWLRFDNPAGGILTDYFSVATGSGQLSVTEGGTVDSWTQFLGFTGPQNDPWNLVFNFTDPGGTARGSIYMDDVTLTERTATSVPEPGSLLLVGIALAAGALVRRRKTH